MLEFRGRARHIIQTPKHVENVGCQFLSLRH
jgi:hypothetical protein